MPSLSRVRCLALEGGGMRAAAQIGALDEAQRHRSLSNLEEVAGTSAGALLALLLALGHSPLAIEFIFRHTNWSAWAPDRWFGRLRSLLAFRKLGGFFSSRLALKWIDERLQRNQLARDVTFAELDRWRRVLIVTATDIERKRVVWYSPRTTPNVPVREAVLASMSIPPVFPPTAVGDCKWMVDGGLGANYPIECFTGRDPAEVLGIKVDNPKEIGEEPDPPRGRVDYLGKLMGSILRLANQHVPDDLWPRTVRVPVDSRVSTTGFDITPEQRRYLLRQGRAAMRKWLVSG